MRQRIKKTYFLDQSLIDRLKKEAGARTETDAITTAMEEFLFRKNLLLWHKKHAGKFRIEDTDA